MSAELVLCALRRAGEPLIASELAERANALGMSEYWPSSALAGSGQRVDRLLKAMEGQGRVRRAGTATVDGKDRLLWEPVAGYDPRAAVPQPPEPAAAARERHPVEGMSRVQILAVFNAQDTAVTELLQQRSELTHLLLNHERRYRDLIERTRVQLAAAGLGDE